MTDADSSLVDFSKHLLITIFAIFAFTSGALLGASNDWVKVLFTLSLITSIVSMTLGFKVVMIKVNEHLRSESEKLPKNIIKEMLKALQWQYYTSIMALGLLVFSIMIYFLTENYYLISVKPY
ncbi:hypothetical protein [Pseudoalteromonas byunsanensis]|nr:hypothetical protein [Pseudoalteromonas byunsanensis]